MRWKALVAAGLFGVAFPLQGANAQTDVGAPEESDRSYETPPAQQQAHDATMEPSGIDTAPVATSQPPSRASSPAEEEVLVEPEPRRRLAWEALQAQHKARASGVSEEEPEEERPTRRAAGIFSKGTFWPSLRVGRDRFKEDTYLVLGAGLGYFVIDGLAPALVYDIWLLGDPTPHQLTAKLTYVFHMVPYVKPYAGSFVRHYFLPESNDQDSIGVYGGLIVPIEPVFFGLGVAYEGFVRCNTRYFDCDRVYPEFLVGVAF